MNKCQFSRLDVFIDSEGLWHIHSRVYFWTFELSRFEKLLSTFNKVAMVFDQTTPDY